MTGNVQGPSPLRPEEKKEYEQEYQHGADLFQRALDQYAKSNNIYQREEFKEVMDKALQVLNETARELKKKALKQQNQLIENDYRAYQSNPSNATQKKLNDDLEKAKREIS